MLANDVAAPRGPRAAPSQSLKQRLFTTRARTDALAEPLSAEDQVVQAMDDASPTKWHRAHTTWFFEAFILEPHAPGYQRFNDRFHYCFNSYYENAGPRHPRAQRGLLTRPSVSEVADYRAHVDAGLASMFASYDDALPDQIAELVELGINHEQQHQELLLTDILSLFAQSPLRPAYRDDYFKTTVAANNAHPSWVTQDGGIRQVGHNGESFHYDNERPEHAVLLQAYRVNRHLVTNAEWLQFIADGAYQEPTAWLSDGWHTVATREWQAPGYWELVDGQWHQMTLAGLIPVDPSKPVSNVSFYEAEAFARWAGKRLPTEFEWEVAVAGHADQLQGLYSDVWQWTASAYAAYPGYRAADGAIGEYNGKFMCNQQVLRGASHATAPGHNRLTYRNFFYPDARWQFTGLRLAEDAA